MLVRGLPPTALTPQVLEEERQRAEEARKSRRLEERQRHYDKTKGGGA